MKGKVDRMIELVGVHSKTSRARLAEIEALFEVAEPQVTPGQPPGGAVPERVIRSSKHH